MLEKKIQIKGISPVELFGSNNANLKYIKSFFPKLKIVARGNIITITGDDEVIDKFEQKFDLILRHFDKFNKLSENNIDNLMTEDGSKLLSSGKASKIVKYWKKPDY